MLSLIKSTVDRFKEPSSYAGLSALLLMVHVSLPSDVLNSATLILSGICGVVSFVIAEKAKPAA